MLSPKEKEDGMHPNRRQILLTFAATFGLTVLTAACASGGSGDGGPRRDPDLITAEELADYTNLTCLEVIRRLRPRWLQSRGAEQNPVVYQDGARIGMADQVLGNFSVNDVQSIRYRNASDATTRYGTGHGAGAIEVSTRRR